jgi:hypothetical protein
MRPAQPVKRFRQIMSRNGYQDNPQDLQGYDAPQQGGGKQVIHILRYLRFSNPTEDNMYT